MVLAMRPPPTLAAAIIAGLLAFRVSAAPAGEQP
jgi:hypothetical protein